MHYDTLHTQRRLLVELGMASSYTFYGSFVMLRPCVLLLVLPPLNACPQLPLLALPAEHPESAALAVGEIGKMVLRPLPHRLEDIRLGKEQLNLVVCP